MSTPEIKGIIEVAVPFNLSSYQTEDRESNAL
jgi:hypothetical protein